MAVKKEDSFGYRLRALRRSKDLTQEELANMIGVQGAAVGKYESPNNNYPSVKGLIKMSEIFNVSIDYLLTGKDADVFAPKKNSSLSVSNVDNSAHSPEEIELLRIYESLKVKDRFKLLQVAFELEDEGSLS